MTVFNCYQLKWTKGYIGLSFIVWIQNIEQYNKVRVVLLWNKLNCTRVSTATEEAITISLKLTWQVSTLSLQNNHNIRPIFVQSQTFAAWRGIKILRELEYELLHAFWEANSLIFDPSYLVFSNKQVTCALEYLCNCNVGKDSRW